MTYEEYLEAAHLALACLDDFPVVTDAGLTEYAQDGGKAVSIWLTTADGDEAADGAYQSCYNANLQYIESAYQQRESVQGWRDAVDAKYIDAIRACIEARGITTEADWTVADMLQAEADQFPDGDVAERCAASTGYEQEMTH